MLKRLNILVALVFAVACLVPASLVAAAPAAESTTWRVQAGIESADRAIQIMSFSPETIEINVGDTIEWTIPTGEPHTITFLAEGQSRPEFNEADPLQVEKQGGDVYDGKSYYNSGLIADGATYRLTFNTPGEFDYICILHPSMNGKVIVREAGTPYPKTQDEYDAAVNTEREAAVAQWQDTLNRPAESTVRADGTTEYKVVMVGDPKVMIGRFLPGNLTIKVGDTVTWVNQDAHAPHTVTFGPIAGNPVLPYGDPTAFDGSTPLNSGFMGEHFPAPATFSVTFTKAGTFDYICVPHSSFGMRGTITVEERDSQPTSLQAADPAPASNAPTTLPRTGAPGANLFVTLMVAGAVTLAAGVALRRVR